MNNNFPTIPCKVVLLGESGVGKTSIISRYVNNTFHSNFVPTMGSCFATKTVPFPDLEKNLKFEIWDTAGQERYRSITKIFYKDANVAILVYDISRRESYEEIKNYWYQQVKDNAPKRTVIVIAANKSDLYEFDDAVPEEEGKTFAKEVEALFLETSAKNALGIDDLFNFAGLKLIDPNFNSTSNPEEEMLNIRVKKNIKLDDGATNRKKNQEKKKCC